MTDKRFLHDSFELCLSHAIEECGEFQKRAGKLQRFGPANRNPLKPEDQETNLDKLRREMEDVRLVMDLLDIAINLEFPSMTAQIMASGWGVIQGGELLINTVSATRRAAMVNWLVTVPKMMVFDFWTDELIEDDFSKLCPSDARVVQVYAVEKLT